MINVSVCLFVCQLAYLKKSKKSPVVVARSSSDSTAIMYVLPVLLMTSYFHVMERISPNQRLCVVFRPV